MDRRKRSVLYSLPAADFHEVTSGSTYGNPWYAAGPGYNLVTGLGTPVANLLVPALACVAVWDGGATGAFSNPADWIAGVTPNPAVNGLILGGSTASSPFNDFPAGSNFDSVTFNGNCTLSGNAALLNSTILNVQGDNCLLLQLVLGDDGVLQVSSGSLTVGGSIANGGNSLTVGTAVSTTATITGSISGAGGLVKNGTGTLRLTGANSYSGGTTVSGGTLQVTSPAAITPGSALIVGSGAELLFDNVLGQSLQIAALPAENSPGCVSDVADDSAASAPLSDLPTAGGNAPVVPRTASSRDAGASGRGAEIGIPPSGEKAQRGDNSVLSLGLRIGVTSNCGRKFVLASAIGKSSTGHGLPPPFSRPRPGPRPVQLGCGLGILCESSFVGCPANDGTALAGAIVDLVLSQWNS